MRLLLCALLTCFIAAPAWAFERCAQQYAAFNDANAALIKARSDEQMLGPAPTLAPSTPQERQDLDQRDRVVHATALAVAAYEHARMEYMACEQRGPE